MIRILLVGIVTLLIPDRLMAERLAPCPATPNCVRSGEQGLAQLRLRQPAAAAWPTIVSVVAALPRCSVVVAEEDYLHAECRSRVFGFVDDLELQLDPAAGSVAFRSAARSGYSDFGVNRRRLDALTASLRRDGVIE